MTLKLYKGQASHLGSYYPPHPVQIMARSRREAYQKLQDNNPSAFISLAPEEK